MDKTQEQQDKEDAIQAFGFILIFIFLFITILSM